MLISFSCTAQRKTERILMKDYPSFYDKTITNVNKLMPHKADFYNRPLSDFLSELKRRNLSIKSYDTLHNTYLRLQFIDDYDTSVEAGRKKYSKPYILIFFKGSLFNYENAMKIKNKNHWYWGKEEEDFYKDLMVEKIEFWDVEGLKNFQRTAK